MKICDHASLPLFDVYIFYIFASWKIFLGREEFSFSIFNKCLFLNRDEILKFCFPNKFSIILQEEHVGGVWKATNTLEIDMVELFDTNVDRHSILYIFHFNVAIFHNGRSSFFEYAKRKGEVMRYKKLLK